VVLLALFSNTRLQDTFTNNHDTTDDLDHIENPRPRRQIQHRLSESEIDEMVERYQAGATIPMLVGEFGVHRTTALRHLELRGVPRRHAVAILGPADIKRAAKLYRQGASLATVGEQLGVGAETVRRAFLKAAVPIRQKGRRSTPAKGTDEAI
jgi:hypothetical protein